MKKHWDVTVHFDIVAETEEEVEDIIIELSHLASSAEWLEKIPDYQISDIESLEDVKEENNGQTEQTIKDLQ